MSFQNLGYMYKMPLYFVTYVFYDYFWTVCRLLIQFLNIIFYEQMF